MNKDQLHPKRQFDSIRHIVEYAAENYKDNIAFSFKQKAHDKEKCRVSYIEFRDDVRALACEMISMGMKGKHIVVVAKMSYDFILTYYATLLIGAVLNGYGITECAPLISVNRSKNVVKGSVGTVLDMDDVKISDPNEDGEGEIYVKGPNVMLGYYKNEEATAEAIDGDGYFKTGDYGKLTKDRILYITGRKKNLIILSNGKNVYPEEIENELISIPGVQDIIVYEGKSKRGIEHNAIVAEIFPDKEYMEKNGIHDEKTYLQDFINEYNKTAIQYKKITVLKVRCEDFPKNTLRKIMRFKLDTSIE